MNKHLAAFLLALTATLAGCAQHASTLASYPQFAAAPAAGTRASADTSQQKRHSDPVGTVGTPLSPAQFLELLKQSPNTYIFVFGETRNWILDTDLESLVARLDSQTPCAGVVSLFSSHSPPGSVGSTEGREAAILIEGYRTGYYPPVLSSDLYFPNREELKRWYQTWNERKQAAR